jgi:hypothetical protein
MDEIADDEEIRYVVPDVPFIVDPPSALARTDPCLLGRK